MDRVTMLPQSIKISLQEHLKRVQQLHQRDLKEGFGEVYLPYALERKYVNAVQELLGHQDVRTTMIYELKPYKSRPRLAR